MATANTKSLFTYATDAQLIADEIKGKQDTYNIVRIIRKTDNTSYGTSTIDYPCKTLESFERDMAKYAGQIIDLYPAIHFHPEPIIDEDY
jgi:hypothetical protein